MLRRPRSAPGERQASPLTACFVVLVLLANSAQSFSREPTGKFLIASDLHFNPFADPTLVADQKIKDVSVRGGIAEIDLPGEVVFTLVGSSSKVE